MRASNGRSLLSFRPWSYDFFFRMNQRPMLLLILLMASVQPLSTWQIQQEGGIHMSGHGRRRGLQRACGARPLLVLELRGGGGKNVGGKAAVTGKAERQLNDHEHVVCDDESNSEFETESEPSWFKEMRERKAKGLTQRVSEESEGELGSEQENIQRLEKQLKEGKVVAKASSSSSTSDSSLDKTWMKTAGSRGKRGLGTGIQGQPSDSDFDDDGERQEREMKGAIDGLSSDSDFGGPRSEGLKDSDSERGQDVPRGVMDLDGEKVVIPGQAGKDFNFLRTLQTHMAKQGLAFRMKLPDEDGKLKDINVDPGPGANVGSFGAEQQYNASELYGANPDKRKLDALRNDLCFDIPSDDEAAERGPVKPVRDKDVFSSSLESEDEAARKERREKKKQEKRARKEERRKRRREEEVQAQTISQHTNNEKKASSDGARGSSSLDTDPEDAGRSQTRTKRLKKQRPETDAGSDAMQDSSSSKSTQDEAAVDEKALAYRAEHQVTIRNWKGKPLTAWDAATNRFGKRLLSVCKGFQQPTVIQAECWPPILAGRDVVGISRTGSGKTLAFALPMLLCAKRSAPLEGCSGAAPCCLVLAPTRELASQSAGVVTAAGNSTGMQCVCVYGGVNKRAQKDSLTSEVRVVVGTPGRLLDLANEPTVLLLSQVAFLVLDEADRMLDLGFEDDVRSIVSQVKKSRQTVMFSATWPTAIQGLASTFMQDHVFISVGPCEIAASPQVTQVVEVIEPSEREARLRELIDEYHSAARRKARVIVFCLYKKEAARVHRLLLAGSNQAVCLHGDMDQAERTRGLKRFREGQVPILVATDVASRGLDIPNVEYVINFAFPLTIEDYVHRIGRTGRADKKGVSHTFFTQHDKAHAGELVGLLEKAKQVVPPEMMKFDLFIKKKQHEMYGHHHKDIDLTAKPTKIKFDF